MTRLLVLVFVLGCSSTKSDAPESLGDLRYTPPSSAWNHSDVQELGRWISRWTPEENVNKESISIIRSVAGQQLAAASPDQLATILVTAQKTLPAPSLRPPTMTKTRNGLVEIEIEADFVPVGLKDSYHRAHALILDGNVLVHVLYTARHPDPELTMFRGVVNSIRREDG